MGTGRVNTYAAPGLRHLRNRHSHGGHSAARKGFECGQTECFQTKHLPGRFKVQMLRNRMKYMGYR